ncbi:hypothetical protein BC828DRAFT_280880 [Blastocladiella britannica]|nr:hypothetical protein BC828DRAFT_280880 [Blastocladiella britannica]
MSSIPIGTQCRDLSVILDALKYTAPWTSSNCCTWPGIGCNDDGTVYALVLGSLSGVSVTNSFDNVAYPLTGTIPESISKLKSLHSLSLSSNQLKGPIPNSLGTMTALNFIYLNDNQLSGSVPPNLDTMESLDGLNLEGNLLQVFPDLHVFNGGSTGSCNVLPQKGSNPCFAGKNRNSYCYRGQQIDDCPKTTTTSSTTSSSTSMRMTASSSTQSSTPSTAPLATNPTISDKESSGGSFPVLPAVLGVVVFVLAGIVIVLWRRLRTAKSSSASTPAAPVAGIPDKPIAPTMYLPSAAVLNKEVIVAIDAATHTSTATTALDRSQSTADAHVDGVDKEDVQSVASLSLPTVPDVAAAAQPDDPPSTAAHASETLSLPTSHDLTAVTVPARETLSLPTRRELDDELVLPSRGLGH